MNKLKRGLELGGAIVSIVLSAFLFIGAIIVLISLDSIGIEDGLDPLVVASAKFVTILLMLLSVVMIILGAMLCKAPAKTSTGYKNRFGITLTYIILLGVLAILEITGEGVVYFILLLIPMGLLIASLCLKHNNVEENLAKENVVSYNNVSSDNTKERIKTLKELKESGLIDEETYQEKLKNIINDL